MATELNYLKDFDVHDCDAQVTRVSATEDGRTDVELDQTCFYPRGGGQDWDTGTISGPAGKLDVEEVRLDEAGVVHHIGTLQGAIQPGETVHGAVDTERRNINTRLHSAGHVVDMAVDRLGLPWTPAKGAHYPHMSFVEYEGDIAPEEAEQTRKQIETIAQEIVAAGGDNEIRFMPVSEMPSICRHVPANIPANKPARVVVYSGTFGVPCGGTHMRNLHDIGAITITKVKSKKGVTKVSYTVDGIN